MLRKAEADGQPISDQPGASTAILVDLLCRAGQLAEAPEAIRMRREAALGDVIGQILDCQSALADAGDLSCYTVAEAIGDALGPKVRSSHSRRWSGTPARRQCSSSCGSGLPLWWSRSLGPLDFPA